MNKASKGIIFDVMRYAIHDGPGIRTTVFLKGCPLKCSWCANPESQHYSAELSHMADKCLLCGLCETGCPEQAIRVSDGIHCIDRKRCQTCGQCTKECPAGALEIIGRTVTVEALYKEIIVDRNFWDRSGGGITLSGGEPLMQPEFCRSLLELCQANYIPTTIETCLHVPKENLDLVLPYVDLFICDCKINNDAKHKNLVGVGNGRIKKNLKYLIERQGKTCLIRMPLIPGLNDTVQELGALAGFLKSLGEYLHLEIMPYHRLGEPKYQRLGREYELKCPIPQEKDLVLAKKVFASQGIGIR